MLAISAELLKNINAGAEMSDPRSLIEVNGTAFFSAATAAFGRELWRSNGTAAGTVLVANIAPGADHSDPKNFVNVNGTLFFRATNGTHGEELWKSDGTATGTKMVADIFPGANNGSFPSNLTNVNGTLFFTARDAGNNTELWRSDGSEGGTFRVRDINPGAAGSLPASLTNVNGTLFFSARTADLGVELWKSNGTFEGTVLVKNIHTTAATGSDPDGLVNVGGTLFFAATDAAGGRELWKSNGTTSGTVRVKDVEGDSSSFGPYLLRNINGTLYFQAATPSTGAELWKSDGTAAGTVQVKDIRPGAASSHPYAVVGVGDRVFFRANDGAHGDELWQSDGTESGTTLVLDVVAGSSFPYFVANIGGNVLFAATDSTGDRELWHITGLPPVIAVSGNVTYTENGAGITLDPQATATGPSATSYSGGNLTVAIATNADGRDLLHPFNVGTGAGQIGVSGSNITFGGVVIGAVAGGSGAAPLVITFNGKARLPAIQELLRSIRFLTQTDNPVPQKHRIEFVLTDGEGNASNTGVVFATTIAVNDVPVLSGLGTSTYTENGDAILIAGSGNVVDPDSANFGGGFLRATVTANGNANDRLGIRSGTPAPGVINVSGTSVRFNTTTIGAITDAGAGSQPLSIELNSSATLVAVRALLRAITFQTAGDNPSTAQRTVRFVANDGDGGTSAAVNALVNVAAVNDAPGLELSGTTSYTRDAAAILLAPGAAVTDLDSADFAFGRLHVQITTGDSSANRLGIAGGFTIDGSNNVVLDGVVIGVRKSDGVGTNDLIIVFNANATVARVQQLVRAVTFRTVAGAAGTRSLLFTVSDGDGGISPIRTKTVKVL